ncbi:putative F-box protein, partial [Mucuna pruriens]
MTTRKRRRMTLEAPAMTSFLPEELMIDILARVRVSNPLHFRCVCKWWKSLVMDPQFVKKHLHVSFSDITDLATKAMEDMNAFQLQLSYAPAMAQQPQEQEQEQQQQEEQEEEEEQEQEAPSLVNQLAQLDNMLVVVRSLKGSLDIIKVDVQAIKERLNVNNGTCLLPNPMALSSSCWNNTAILDPLLCEL